MKEKLKFEPKTSKTMKKNSEVKKRYNILMMKKIHHKKNNIIWLGQKHEKVN